MNMYQDKKNQAYSNVFKSIFPEQTKTVPRIIIWSVIFLVDLIAVCVLAVRWGIFEIMDMKTAPLVIGAVAIFLFWLEGFVFYSIAKLFR